ncbi:MAG: hypothetical protein KAF91_13080 [Nostoc sp. TH1S01]|nr:hypothetical protein [Nostoc sp. TH1S01]
MKGSLMGLVNPVLLSSALLPVGIILLWTIESDHTWFDVRNISAFEKVSNVNAQAPPSFAELIDIKRSP